MVSKLTTPATSTNRQDPLSIGSGSSFSQLTDGKSAEKLPRSYEAVWAARDPDEAGREDGDEEQDHQPEEEALRVEARPPAQHVGDDQRLRGEHDQDGIG